MSKHEFKQGDTVYLADGMKAEFIAALPFGEFVVRPFWTVEAYDYQSEDVEEHEAPGQPMTVEHVYPSPPKPVIDEEILQAEARLKAIRAEIRDCEREQREAEKTYRERLLRLAKLNPLLEHVEDVIEGRITHFVVIHWDGPRIETREDCLKDDEGNRYKPDLRLLSLYGKTGGDLAWRVSRYSDGSGSKGDVIPCTSEAEAVERLRAFVEAKFAEGKPGYNGGYIKAADKYGIPVPEAVRKAFWQSRRSEAESQIRRFNEDAAKWQKVLDDIEAGK